MVKNFISLFVKKIMSIFHKEKTQKSNFKIVEADVKKHAPILYGIIQDHLGRLNACSHINDQKGVIKSVKRKWEDDFSINESDSYSELFLDIDRFRIAVVYHLCISRLLNKNIDFMEYEFYKMLLEKVMMENLEKDYLSYETLMLKTFKVDPSVMPVKHLQLISSMDEFAMASEIVSNQIEHLDPPSKYETYDGYYEYMSGEVKKIIFNLNQKGFYATLNEETMTVACISRKMGLPPQFQGILYKGSAPDDETIPLEAKSQIQKKIFETLFNKDGFSNGGPGGFGFNL